MAGINKVFETARRSLFAQRNAMDVTAHNIANAGTVGYTRQRADLTTTAPTRESVGLLGSGVELSSVSRLRDNFIDTQVRNSQQSLGSSTLQSRIFDQIEAIMNEPSSNGLQSMMQNFSKAWQTLATTPEDLGARQIVLQSARSLSTGIKQIQNNFSSLRSDIKDEIVSKVNKINTLTSQISDLNKKILDASNANLTANDLMDTRDNKIDELSQLANVKTYEDTKGVIRVNVGGVTVADENSAVPFSVTDNGTTLSVGIASSTSAANINSGELGGMLTHYNDVIPKYMSDIDTLATSIFTEVNTVHNAGFGLGTPAPTGNDFFSSYTNGTLTITPTIESDPRLIAASKTGAAGDNDVATQIANIFETPTMNGGTVTHQQYYNMLLGKIGSDASRVKQETDGQQLIMIQLQSQRNSFSAVSLDEEMTNMIKFQRSYDASAKLIKAVDEMMSTIIQMV